VSTRPKPPDAVLRTDLRGRSVAGQWCWAGAAPATLATAAGGAPTGFSRTLVDSTLTTTRLWTIQNVGGSFTPPLSLQGNVEYPASGHCLNLVRQDGASCALTISFAAIRRNSLDHADADESATAAAAPPGDLVAPNDVARGGKR
jgi:hypothetical protein